MLNPWRATREARKALSNVASNRIVSRHDGGYGDWRVTTFVEGVNTNELDRVADLLSRLSDVIEVKKVDDDLVIVTRQVHP